MNIKELVRTGELAVFASGLVGLGLQILAGRLLTPEFGSSVYTWGSIIGVFMIALSVGYLVGGKYAHTATKQHAIYILLLSAFFVILLALFGQPLAEYFGSWNIAPQYAALPAVIILFGPTTFLFGLLTPYAVTLSTKRHKGHASGRIFALDTIGSIVGSFGATFILIPTFDLITSFIILGSVALLAAISMDQSMKTILLVAGLAILFIVVGTVGRQLDFTPAQNETILGTLKYEKQTPYQFLEVRDTIHGVRVLFLDGQQQSAMDVNSPFFHPYKYTRYFYIPLLIKPDAQSVLFMGAGGFTGPKDFADQGFSVTVAELDPVVVQVGETYFFVDPETMNINVIDAREHLSRTNNVYDILYMDAYRKDKVPFHLATKEFYDLAYDHLSEDGVLWVNVIGIPDGENALWFKTMLRTVQEVFPTVYTFSMHEDNRLQNLIIVASKDAYQYSPEELVELSKKQPYRVNVTSLLQTQRSLVDTANVQVLYDDKAPVDRIISSSIAGLEFILTQNE